MKRLAFTPAARDDLMASAAYIANDYPLRAESFVSELEAKARQNGRTPRRLSGPDDHCVSVRAAVHGRYLLLFRELADEVLIAEGWEGDIASPYFLWPQSDP